MLIQPSFKNVGLLLLLFVFCFTASGQINQPILGQGADSGILYESTFNLKPIDSIESTFAIAKKIKKDSSFSLEIRFDERLGFQQQLKELEVMMRAVVLKSDSVYNLSHIYIGRFINTNDLAVKATQTYIQKFGSDQGEDSLKKRLPFFIKNSEIYKVLKTALEKHQIEITRIEAPKVKFLPLSGLTGFVKSIVDPLLPNKLIDAEIYLFTHKKN